MDRIDIFVPVSHIDYDTLSSAHIGEGSDAVSSRVKKARSFAKERFAQAGSTLRKNKDIAAKDIDKLIFLNEEAKTIMKKLATSHSLSPRAYHRVIRVARTIADLDESEAIEERHILEAFQYRPKLYSTI